MKFKQLKRDLCLKCMLVTSTEFDGKHLSFLVRKRPCNRVKCKRMNIAECCLKLTDYLLTTGSYGYISK